MTHTFYRVVATDPPTRGDYLSYVALGISFEEDRHGAAEMARGVSVNATLAQARHRTRDPFPGLYIAELAIEDGSSVTFARTGARGHHTLWGDPDVLLGCVVSVVHVRELD